MKASVMAINEFNLIFLHSIWLLKMHYSTHIQLLGEGRMLQFLKNKDK